MNRLISMAAIIAIALVVAVFGGTSTPAQAADVCPPLDSGKINTVGDPATVTVTAPAGFLIDRYCVKAGPTPVFINVNDLKTVVVDYPGIDSVSHYSLSYTVANTTTSSTTTSSSTSSTSTTSSTSSTSSTTTSTVPDYTTAVRGTTSTVERYPDPCIIDAVRYPEGEYVIDWDNPQGTTEWGFFPCSLPDPEHTTTTTTAPPTELPKTGGEVQMLLIAAALTMGGFAAVRFARA